MVSVFRIDQRVLADGVDHRGLYFSVAVADPSDFYFGGKVSREPPPWPGECRDVMCHLSFHPPPCSPCLMDA